MSNLKVTESIQDKLITDLVIHANKDENYDAGWDVLVEAYTTEEIIDYLDSNQIRSFEDAVTSFEDTWRIQAEYAQQFVDTIDY